MRLLTTKRVRSIVKTAAKRHDVTIKADKTRQYVWYSHMINSYGPQVRRIEYYIGAVSRTNVVAFLEEVNSLFSLRGAPTTDSSHINSNNTIRFKIDAVLK
jgi:hypothetical protein